MNPWRQQQKIQKWKLGEIFWALVQIKWLGRFHIDRTIGECLEIVALFLVFISWFHFMDNSYMSCHWWAHIEHSATVFTGVWLLTSMNTHVPFHVAFLRKWLLAKFTSVGLFSWMCPVVQFQISSRFKAFSTYTTIQFTSGWTSAREVYHVTDPKILTLQVEKEANFSLV
jgi:hypothetical protein